MGQGSDVVGLVRKTLGAGVVGAYRHGSAVRGGLRPFSDIDVLVITDSTLDDSRRRALLDGLSALSGSGPEPCPDLAVLLTMTRTGNSVLFGPPPEQVLDPVPPEDVRRAITEAVPELLTELESDTRNVLLTLARVWMSLATGEIASKDEAAAWASDRLPADNRAALAPCARGVSRCCRRGLGRPAVRDPADRGCGVRGDSAPADPRGRAG